MQFDSMVNVDFAKFGGIVEKYNVEQRTSRLGNIIHYGYRVDVIGFGWTNAVYLELINYLRDSVVAS